MRRDSFQTMWVPSARFMMMTRGIVGVRLAEAGECDVKSTKSFRHIKITKHMELEPVSTKSTLPLQQSVEASINDDQKCTYYLRTVTVMTYQWETRHPFITVGIPKVYELAFFPRWI